MPSISLGNFIKLYQGSFLISSIANLLAGFTFNMFLINSLPSSDTNFGIVYSPFNIFLYRTAVLAS